MGSATKMRIFYILLSKCLSAILRYESANEVAFQYPVVSPGFQTSDLNSRVVSQAVKM